jgi:nitrilase
LNYPSLKVAAVQAASVCFDKEQTLGKALRLIEEAAEKGATLIGFPELFIPGHPDLWYAAKKSNPLPVQGKLFKQLVKNAIQVPGQDSQRICAAAKKVGAYIVMGIIEVDSLYPGTLYISQLVVSDRGEILGVHRKLVSTMAEKLVFSQGDGSHLRVFETRFGKLSALNCGEHSHSLIKYALLSLGTQFHVASWPSFPGHLHKQSQVDSIDFRVRQFAHEGKIFILNACGITDEQNIQACCNTPEEQSAIVKNSGGGSSIIGPNGEYLAGPLYGAEGILTAEISLENALPGKQVHNILGHYSRWDVLSLNFNRTRLSPICDNTNPGTESIG